MKKWGLSNLFFVFACLSSCPPLLPEPFYVSQNRWDTSLKEKHISTNFVKTGFQIRVLLGCQSWCWGQPQPLVFAGSWWVTGSMCWLAVIALPAPAQTGASLAGRAETGWECGDRGWGCCRGRSREGELWGIAVVVVKLKWLRRGAEQSGSEWESGIWFKS